MVFPSSRPPVGQSGVMTFRGIRYGAEKGGANRFMAPAKPEPWTGVYDAFAYGPAAPQMPGNPRPAYTGGFAFDGDPLARLGDDAVVT